MYNHLFPLPGCVLPSFRTLLIKGPYSASSPLHLCLSHLESRSASRALILTPSRDAFTASLEEFNDHWLLKHSGTGKTSSLLSKITIFYPPTPAHWLLLLSSLIPLQSHPNSAPLLAALPTIPSLIVLHEPSSFFLGTDDTSFNVSQYVNLIVNALSSTSYLSAYNSNAHATSGNAEPPQEHISVAVFDSQADDLRLPLLARSPESGFNPFHEEDESVKTKFVSKEQVGKFLEKYFEWVGTVENVPRHSTSTDLMTGEESLAAHHAKRIVLRKSNEQDVPLEWAEVVQPRRRDSELPETSFEWTNT
ncbi:hypothetical protein BD410DRAFT_784267 [Rickenella mellea]|uniref:Uncharacterized protein n=1 Tax=Rickenella mellea TaxID=50990 RepID=A0A4Y7QGG8_9AGAM|nr:hypothetical protein BD410DRAFT_784267 [Rickenella mellea]